jgi:hypothetical protein
MRTMSLFAVLSIGALIGAAQADQHHGGHAQIQGKGAGKHVVHVTPNGHTAHAHVNKNGRVANMTVTHPQHSAAQLKVTKVKTKAKKHAQAPLPPDDVFVAEGESALGENLFVGAEPSEAAQVQIWVGWAFYNPNANMWIFIWFPINLVEGGDQGAVSVD